MKEDEHIINGSWFAKKNSFEKSFDSVHFHEKKAVFYHEQIYFQLVTTSFVLNDAKNIFKI